VLPIPFLSRPAPSDQYSDEDDGDWS